MLGIYTRLSREDEASNSIANQQREGKAFANSKQLEYKLYDEGEGVSGAADLEDRPILSSLMKDIEKGVITSIWFRNQDRLERNTLTFAKFSMLAESLKVEVYFDGQLVDYSSPEHELTGGILSYINQFQRKLQSKKTKRALLDNIKEGKAHGIPPFGYMKGANSMLEINDEEAEIVRTIYSMSLEGKGTSAIAIALNELNVPTRYNGYNGTITLPNKKKVDKKAVKWAGNTIRSIIINPIYKGQRKWGEEVFECPSIFEESYWQKVNENLKSNANNSGKKVEYRYLLKGIIKCGRCGRNYYGRSRESKKDHYYMCSSKRQGQENCGNRSINIDFIEGLVWTHCIVDKNFQKCVLKHFEELKGSDVLVDIDAEIKAAQNSLNKLKKQEANILDAIADDVIDKEQARQKNKSLKVQINDEQQKLNNLNEQRLNYTLSQENEKDILNELDLAKKEFSFIDRQSLVRKYVQEIDVSFREDRKDYIIQIIPKLTGMNPIRFIVPYNKQHAFGVFSMSSETDDYIATLYNPNNNLAITNSLYHIFPPAGTLKDVLEGINTRRKKY